MRILRKRFWPFFTALAIVLSVVALWTWRQTPMYRATAHVLIERQTPKLGNMEDLFALWAYNQDYYQTQVKILESPGLAENVIKKLNLADSFKGPDPAARFKSGLDVVATRNNRVLEINYLHPDPKIAADIVNALIAEYAADSIQRRVAGIRSFHDQLRQQAEEQRGKLADSEKALLDYNRLHGLVSGDEKKSAAQQRLEEAGSSLSRSDDERRSAETQWDLVKAAGDDVERLKSLKPVQASQLIKDLVLEQSRLKQTRAEMLKSFKPAHPSILAAESKIAESDLRIRAEIDTIVAGIKAQFEEASARVEKAKADFAKRKEEKAELDRVLANADVLRRERDANQLLYDGLIKQIKEADVTGQIEITNVHVLAPAKLPLPPARPSPAKPSWVMNLGLGALMGLLVAAGLVYLLEAMDTTVRTPEDIERGLGVPILSVVPEVKSNGVVIVPATVAWKEEKSQAAEAFRGLRTTVLLSVRESSNGHGPQEVKKIVLTSSGPDEGKTVSACNLAISLAQAGYRTVLLDADFHRPQHHKIFGLKNELGLSNVLAGTGDLTAAIVGSEIPKLDLLPAGPTPPQPAALLGSPRFKEVVNRLAGEYDRVIIDTPPVGAVSDACLVAPAGDALLLVVQPGLTMKPSVKRTVQQLARLGVRPLGAIMNKIAHHEGAYYYKYYHYYNKDSAQRPIRELRSDDR